MMEYINLGIGKAFIFETNRNGNNSICFKVKIDTKIFFLKLMNYDFDVEFDCDCMPKLICKGTCIWCEDRYYYRLYEYIDGDILYDLNRLSLEDFKKLIYIGYRISMNGYSLYDMNAFNFVKRYDGKFFLVDYGAIKKKEEAYSDYICPYVTNSGLWPDEHKHPKTNNLSEAIEIFYYGQMIKENFETIDKKCIKHIKKMCEKSPNNRYKKYSEIYSELFNEETQVII